jgi:cytochrome P450
MTVSAPDIIPVLGDDPFSEDNLKSPERFQKRLRDGGPVVWLSTYGCYAVGGYEEAAQVFADWRTYSSARGIGISDFNKEKPWRDPAVLLETDPPRHNEIRTKVNRILSQKALEDMRGDFSKQADNLLDRVLRDCTIDAQKEIAVAYPLKVFGDAIGVTPENRENLILYGDMAFNNFGPINALREAANKKCEEARIVPWIMEQTQRGALRPGSLGEKFHQLAEDGLITHYEAWNVMRGQLTAGVDTTVAAIGHLLLCLARDPDQYALVRENTSLTRKAFDETVRHLSPLQHLFRTSINESSLGGATIRADTKMMISIAAANRDPRKWREPDQFDITRNAIDHLAFGRGVHICAGMNVAKLEAECLLTSFTKRVKAIELCGAPTYTLNNTTRRLETLPVKVTLY